MSISFVDNSNPKDVMMVACIGENGYATQRHYYEGYKKTVELVKENFVYNPDTLVYSVLYSIRHSIELGLKICLSQIQKVVAANLDSKGHSLRELFEECENHLVPVEPRYGDLFDGMRTSILEFDAVDPTAQVFRYRNDVDGVPHFQGQSRLDVGLACEKAREVFRKIDDAIDLSNEVVSDFNRQKEKGHQSYMYFLSNSFLKKVVEDLPPLSKWTNAVLKGKKDALKKKFCLSNSQLQAVLDEIKNSKDLSAPLDDSTQMLQRQGFIKKFLDLMDGYRKERALIPDGGLGLGFDSKSIKRFAALNELNKKYSELINSEDSDDVAFAYALAYLGVHATEFDPGTLYDVVEKTEKYCEEGMRYIDYLLNEDTYDRILEGMKALGISG